jgi:rhodanese-related sulfurtransferase
MSLLVLALLPMLAQAQLRVVADEACLKYAVDIASFATCEGDRVVLPAEAPTLILAALLPGEVPALKRSDAGLHVSAAEADRLRSNYPGQVLIVDIRSRIESTYAGRPEVVDIHVPYREPVLPSRWTASGRPQTERNAEFVAEVRAELARLDASGHGTILLLCRSGELSAIAADALAATGVPQVFTIVDGFEGDLSASGRRDVNGWKNAGGRWTALTQTAAAATARR